MKLRFSAIKTAAFVIGLLALVATGCSQPTTQSNANSANANSTPTSEKKGGLPPDAKPMGQVAPGFYMAGPTGTVTMDFTAPGDGAAIQGNSVAPTFNITNYPIYKDDERNKGQHIHVILDNEPYEADYAAATPFNPPNGVFNNLKPGLHTLRAFPSREWHESIKQPDGEAFDMRVFYVGQKPAGAEINEDAPLLTYSRPKGEYRWKEDPRGLLLDFYVTNAKISGTDHKVKYTLDGKSTVLTRWEPVWLQYEQLGPGEHNLVLELLDKDNKPVPYKVGNMDYNRTTRKFRVFGEFEQVPPANQNGNANANRGH